MDGLRWLLLLFGALAIVGVYWFSQRERSRIKDSSSTESTNKRLEPLLNVDDKLESTNPEGIADSADEADDDAKAKAKAKAKAEDDDAPQVKQKIVTLRIVARGQSAFAGDELALSLRGIGMRHGKFGIFHRYEGSDESKIIFSAASLVEPGSFDLANLKSQEIPGISLFMVLPGPVDGLQAFDLMMMAARALSQALNADLLDESGSTLSIQRERFLREEIIQYQTASLLG